MFEFQETQDVLFDKVIEISVSILRDTIGGQLKRTYIHYIAKSIGSPSSNEQVWLL